MTFRQSSEGKSVRESQDVRQEKQRARRLGVCLNKKRAELSALNLVAFFVNSYELDDVLDWYVEVVADSFYDG